MSEWVSEWVIAIWGHLTFEVIWHLIAIRLSHSWAKSDTVFKACQYNSWRFLQSLRSYAKRSIAWDCKGPLQTIKHCCATIISLFFPVCAHCKRLMRNISFCVRSTTTTTKKYVQKHFVSATFVSCAYGRESFVVETFWAMFSQQCFLACRVLISYLMLLSLSNITSLYLVIHPWSWGEYKIILMDFMTCYNEQNT